MAAQTAVRRSAIAGTWYPGSPDTLKRTVEDYLVAAAPPALPGPVLALISPHAGYTYSGLTAAHAYALIRGAGFRRVVLVGPLHRPIRGSRLGPFMVPSESAYRTPLGDVAIDRDFVNRLAESVELTPVQGDTEHALEIELPFLQLALGDFGLIPIMLGESLSEHGAQECIDALAEELARLSDDQTLLVVSTDLTHLDNHDRVVAQDRRLIEMLEAYDVAGLEAGLERGEVQACGATGLALALRWGRRRGAKGARVVAYTTSGDVTGDRRPGVYTVGYLAAALYG